MLKSSIILAGQRFQLESWVREDLDHNAFKLGFQVFNGNPNIKPQPMSFRMSREFVDDDIKDGASIEYLEAVSHKMLETHAEDILSGKANNSDNIKRWLVKAKNDMEGRSN